MECQKWMTYARRIVRLLLLVGAWTGVHHSAVNIYQHTCAPRSITGFAMSALIISAPHCTALRWVMNLGASSVVNTWTILGSLAVGEMCRDFIIKSPKRCNVKYDDLKSPPPLRCQ